MPVRTTLPSCFFSTVSFQPHDVKMAAATPPFLFQAEKKTEERLLHTQTAVDFVLLHQEAPPWDFCYLSLARTSFIWPFQATRGLWKRDIANLIRIGVQLIRKREWILGKQPTNVCHHLLPVFKRCPYSANLLQIFFFQRYKMSQIKLKSNLHLVFFLSTQGNYYPQVGVCNSYTDFMYCYHI